MHTHTPRRPLAHLIGLALGLAGLSTASADITLRFENNATPSSPPLPLTLSSSSAPDVANFSDNTEFRVVTASGSATNNGHKDVIVGGETWVFDTQRQFRSVGGADSIPGVLTTNHAPITNDLAGFPLCPAEGSCLGLEKSATFLSTTTPFNFLAPVVGSPAGDTYGVGIISLALGGATPSFQILFPVLTAQFGGGSYIIGADPIPNAKGDKFLKGVGPGVPFNTDPFSPNTITIDPVTGDISFPFRLHGERRMTRDEVTIGAFGAQSIQFELPGTVTIDNQAPTANADAITGAVGQPTQLNVLQNDSDPDHALLGTASFDVLAVAAVTDPPNGALQNNGTSVTYTPDPGFIGVDEFTYTLSDGRQGMDTATVSVLLCQPDACPPTATNDSAETNRGVPVEFNVLTSGIPDSDPDGDAITLSAVTPPASGSQVQFQPDGTVRYTPAPGFNGTDSFTYTVRDSTNRTDTATVTVTVDPFIESSAGTVVPDEGSNNGIVVPSVEDTDVEQSCVGGCFGFTVNAVPPSGMIDVVLLRLSTVVPERPVYRKLINGAWQNLAAPDVAQSAPLGANGLCPPPGSGSYRALTQGDVCVQLTLTDEGPNDAAQGVSGTIADPGGVARGVRGLAPVQNLSDGGFEFGGCTASEIPVAPAQRADWWLMGGLLAWLGLARRSRRTH